MKSTKTRFLTRIAFLIIVFEVIEYVLLSYFDPFGSRLTYSLRDGIAGLYPDERTQQTSVLGESVIRQLNDNIYFDTHITHPFDEATVTITYRNSDPSQTLYLGFKDSPEWHYQLTPIHLPILNDIAWSQTGTFPVLWQQKKIYATVDDFLNNPPNELIGTYLYTPDMNIYLKNYKPSNHKTVIDIPLRGEHTLFVYLENEPFIINMTKNDLNWYSGEDPLTLKVFKNDELIVEKTVADDGVIDDSRVIRNPQIVSLTNNSEQNPEAGVYKVIIDTGQDTIITKIETNLHKIIFSSPISLAGNAQMYPSIIDETRPTHLFTNSSRMSAKTNHAQGMQTITLNGNQEVPISELKQEISLRSTTTETALTIPQNDLVIYGNSYFAVSSDQFFVPSPLYQTLPVTHPIDLNNINYLLSLNYTKPIVTGDWNTAQHTFDLKSAMIKNQLLNWIIQAPSLTEKGNEVLIKNITVTFKNHSMISL